MACTVHSIWMTKKYENENMLPNNDSDPKQVHVHTLFVRTKLHKILLRALASSFLSLSKHLSMYLIYCIRLFKQSRMSTRQQLMHYRGLYLRGFYP